jgi:hypothetical protein
VTSTPGELYLIVEYCRHGNLQLLLAQRRDEFICQVGPA